ncbi:MAG: biopolymer transporter ExbD [Flavobacteriales bacterium]|nr:biopolymer transporter ExbD [Flavobacteriales bacterium]MBP6573392.1 biopolymer transporter ExbD [Flavobacteriales bacterium]
MADVQTGDGGGGGGRHQKKRAKKSSTHIDMTPMVDLAFLLLTFFILTTTMYKPSTLQMTYPVPKEDQEEEDKKVENAITMFLTKKDAIFYYRGGFEPGITQLERTDFDQLSKVLVVNNKKAIEKVQALDKDYAQGKVKEAQYDSLWHNIVKQDDALFCIIKTDQDARYRNVIDIVDEMGIHAIDKFSVQDSIKPDERALLDIAKQQL